MKKYEVYTVEKDGTLKPTGIWDRGYKINQVEDTLGRCMKKLDKPCIIVISNLPLENPKPKE